MSSREFLLNLRAAQTTFAHLSSELGKFERRARWPGAVHFQEDPGAVDVAEYLLPAGARIWKTIISATLDPGGWLLIAATRVNIDTTVVNKFTKVSLQLNGEIGVEWASIIYTGGGAPDAFLQTHQPVYSVTEFTVDVEVACGVDSSSGVTDVDAFDTTLTAIPL